MILSGKTDKVQTQIIIITKAVSKQKMHERTNVSVSICCEKMLAATMLQKQKSECHVSHSDVDTSSLMYISLCFWSYGQMLSVFSRQNPVHTDRVSHHSHLVARSLFSRHNKKVLRGLGVTFRRLGSKLVQNFSKPIVEET